MEKTIKILKKPITSTVLAVLCGLIVSMVILAFAGYNPFRSVAVLFQGIFARPKSIASVIIKATPIILTGLSVSFAFKTGLFNIGAEGQYIAATIASTVVGTMLDLPPILQVPIVVLSGVVMGGLLGSLVGILKARFGIHEVITSIMFNWIMLNLCNFVSNLDALHKPNTTGTYPVNESSYTMVLYKWKTSAGAANFFRNNKFWREVLLKTDLNYGIIVAIVLAFAVWFLLYRTKMGFEVRAVGYNIHASKSVGIGVKRNIVYSMLIAGALAGLAGALNITGISPHNISTISVFENNGFNGLSVALIAGSSPIGCIFAGLLFSGLIYGGQSVQSVVGAPSEIINIMIGTIVFFVALANVIPALADRLSRKVAE